jgi:hypothetical protein
MMGLLRLLGSLYYRAFGSKHLHYLEELALNAWRDSLSSDAKRVLDAQLHAALFVQRQAMGAKLCFFYARDEEVPTFSDGRPDLHAATVVLTDTEKPEATMNVKVFVHRGRFFSIEFPKRPRRYLELHSMREDTMQAVQVQTHVKLE